MFGIKILTKKRLKEREKKIAKIAYNKAISDIIDLLRGADKIVLEPMTVVGHVKLTDCVFLGIDRDALTVMPKPDKNACN